MIIYAWFNRNFRPIRAKKMSLTTLLHIAGILWFVGNIPSNGHVKLVGVFSYCKLWIVWFRVFFCFMYAAVLILRFFALDRVFNQNKSFKGWTFVLCISIVILVNVIYCLVTQLIRDDLTVSSMEWLEVCNGTQGFRIACIAFQWVLWLGVAVLIYRLRNIQSSFNEFRESLAIFVVAIITLTETTVMNIAFKNYPLMMPHRIEKTMVDTLCANVMVWLILGHPVYMCLFHRRKYETQWLEKLTKDGHKHAYEVSSAGQGHSTAYAKMEDESAFQNTQLNFGTMDVMASAFYGNQRSYYGGDLLVDESTLRSGEMFQNPDTLPIALRNNLHIHRPVLNVPSMFATGYPDPQGEGRRVI
ncbi:hypothetical protein H4R27_004477 [Coemansia aciculifera]|uniref:Uncharacterized protein n=2 Tax=Coemansia TaxID=4863 RepID=A0A9W8LAH2_9FUNG|nr:hypothetical protein GGI19_003942 [Coemansia pectinata]KAJ2880832.1 hypothetical protein H4R27_004477 [Coemansia aciculifera]